MDQLPVAVEGEAALASGAPASKKYLKNSTKELSGG